MSAENQIVWFEETVNEPPPQISINKDGYISIGSVARRILPEYVHFGFDASTKHLLLKEDTTKKGYHVNTVRKKNPRLTIFMSRHKVTFPAVFCIEENTSSPGIWEGTLLENTELYLIKEIQKLAAGDLHTARSCDSMQSLLELYHPRIRAICRSIGKTIPWEDRFQIAQEGFIQATLQYKSNLHIFSEYVMEHTKKFLKQHIARYSGSYKEFYPLEKSGRDGSSYETLSSKTALRSLEDMLNHCDLEQRLSPMEWNVYNRLSEGYTKEEIQDEYGLTSQQYSNIKNRIRKMVEEPDF